MSEIEWEKEARRVLIAFEAPPGDARMTEKFEFEGFDDDYGRRIIIDKGDFGVSVWFEETSPNWSFVVGKPHSDQIDCSDWPNNPFISWRGNHLQYTSLLVRAMFRLGLDISPLETQFNLNITAHEKLEWQLEFQRRLREETSQVE